MMTGTVPRGLLSLSDSSAESSDGNEPEKEGPRIFSVRPADRPPNHSIHARAFANSFRSMPPVGCSATTKISKPRW